MVLKFYGEKMQKGHLEMFSDNVVLHLIKDLEKDKHKVFFDNLFVSPELMIQLRHQGVFAVRTLRSHGSRGCPITTEWKMRKEVC